MPYYSTYTVHYLKNVMQQFRPLDNSSTTDQFCSRYYASANIWHRHNHKTVYCFLSMQWILIQIALVFQHIWKSLLLFCTYLSAGSFLCTLIMYYTFNAVKSS